MIPGIMIICMIIIAIVIIAVIIVAIAYGKKPSQDNEYNDSVDIKTYKQNKLKRKVTLKEKSPTKKVIECDVQSQSHENITNYEPNYEPNYFTDKAGSDGEKTANHLLKQILNEGDYLLNNVVLPLTNGHSVEIDYVLISQKGIFCIEIKNWSGHISGSNEDEHWCQEYDEPNKNNKKPKNPIIQNNFHSVTLSKMLLNIYKVYNIIIFVNQKVDLSNIKSEHVFTFPKFKEDYQTYDKYLKPIELKNIYNRLQPYIANLKQLEERKKEILGN